MKPLVFKPIHLMLKLTSENVFNIINSLRNNEIHKDFKDLNQQLNNDLLFIENPYLIKLHDDLDNIYCDFKFRIDEVNSIFYSYEIGNETINGFSFSDEIALSFFYELLLKEITRELGIYSILNDFDLYRQLEYNVNELII